MTIRSKFDNDVAEDMPELTPLIASSRDIYGNFGHVIRCAFVYVHFYSYANKVRGSSRSCDRDHA